MPRIQLFAILFLITLTAAMCAPQATAPLPPAQTSIKPTATTIVQPTSMPIRATATIAQPTLTATEPPIEPTLTPILDTAIPTAGRLAAQVVAFKTADGATISAELYGAGDTAVIFSVMGNCKQGWTEVAQAAAAQGLLAMTYQWRGCTTDPNNETLLKQFVEDTRGAIAFARSHGAQRIILVGASLGGCASAKLSGEDGVIGLVAVASPDEIKQWNFRIDAADVATTIPKLFITAENDSVVPATATRALHDLAAEPKEWQTYPGTAHGTDLFATQFGPAVSERILKFLLDTAT